MSNDEPGTNQTADDYGTRGPPTPSDLRDKAYLQWLYHDEGLSQRDIAERVGCGDSTVSRWFSHHEIESHPPGDRTPFPKLEDGEWLRDKYEDSRLSAPDIAETVGCSADTVRRWLHKHGIEVREPGYLVGEDCPAYIDGRSHERNYGGGIWQRARRETLRRDGHVCRRCGETEQSHIGEYGRGLEVHHIRPFRLFDSLDDAHRLSNLITLCRPCHKRMEGLPIDNREVY